MSADLFEIATPKARKYKLFFWGPEGSFKTRTALRLGNVGPTEEPALAIIDTESGSEHYSGEFRFRRKNTVDPDEVFKLVKSLVRNPGNIKTLVIDSFSVYYQSLVSKYADLFLKRELTSKGNKSDYYVIQPRDYQAINREAYNFIRMLIASDLNVIAVCHAKDKWNENMQIDGKTPDAPKKMGYYFDTVIEIDMGVDGDFHGIVRAKDRTNKLTVQEEIPWTSDLIAADYISKAFGHTLAETSSVEPVEVNLSVGPDFGVKDKVEEEAAAPTLDEGVAVEAVIPTEKVTPPNNNRTSDDYLKEIAELKADAKIVDREGWLKILSRYDVKTANHMTAEQMEDLITHLKTLVVPF